VSGDALAGRQARAVTAADAASGRTEIIVCSEAVVKATFTHGCGEYRTSLPLFLGLEKRCAGAWSDDAGRECGQLPFDAQFLVQL
jgi:hypothetical protein